MHTEAERRVSGETEFVLNCRLVSEIATTTAVLLRQLQTDQPRGACLVPELTFNLMLFGPAFLMRSGLSTEERCRVLAKQPLVIGFPPRAVVGKQFRHVFPLRVSCGVLLRKKAAALFGEADRPTISQEGTFLVSRSRAAA